MSNKQHKYIVLFLTLLFIAYYSSSTLFPHVHIVDDTPITHSHPYSNASHTHSGSGAIHISDATSLPFILISAITALAFSWKLLRVIGVVEIVVHGYREAEYKSLRAPPALS